jgi:hypothetical protein
MKFIDKLLQKVENSQIDKIVRKIKMNNNSVSINMYSEFIDCIESVRWDSYETEREIEFINGKKVKCFMCCMQ